MKKILITGVALMLAGGAIAPVFADDATPGISITGDARGRFYYKSDDYFNNFGNNHANNLNTGATTGYSSQTNFDSRVRFDLTGTAAGGAYVKGRLRLMENTMSDMPSDVSQINNLSQNNLWADKAYFGIPFTKDVTLEIGKYRSTYGPLPLTYNFFYDDVNLAGARGIVKIGKNIEINPFVEWMRDGQDVYTASTTTASSSGNSTLGDLNGASDQRRDHDEIRYGAHAKVKLNPDWLVGGMLGYQTDQRNETPGTATSFGIQQNEGFFGSVYVNGKAGAIGLVGEMAYTAANLNGFNNWREDYNNSIPADAIGSKNNGYGGWVFPNINIDKLNLGLNIGTTQEGFLPDRAFGFVMLGSADNSVITAQQIGLGGNWAWVGFVPSYTFNDSLKLTGNFVYANISSQWSQTGDGPGFVKGTNQIELQNALEISAILQYTVSKGANIFFSVGYLDPSLEYVNKGTTAATAASPLQEQSVVGAATRFELAF